MCKKAVLELTGTPRHQLWGHIHLYAVYGAKVVVADEFHHTMYLQG